MRDLVADWKRWSRAERVGVTILISFSLVGVFSLPFLVS